MRRMRAANKGCVCAAVFKKEVFFSHHSLNKESTGYHTQLTNEKYFLFLLRLFVQLYAALRYVRFVCLFVCCFIVVVLVFLYLFFLVKSSTATSGIETGNLLTVCSRQNRPQISITQTINFLHKIDRIKIFIDAFLNY